MSFGADKDLCKDLGGKCEEATMSIQPGSNLCKTPIKLGRTHKTCISP